LQHYKLAADPNLEVVEPLPSSGLFDADITLPNYYYTFEAEAFTSSSSLGTSMRFAHPERVKICGLRLVCARQASRPMTPVCLSDEGMQQLLEAHWELTSIEGNKELPP
jgi:hypothetical protein